MGNGIALRHFAAVVDSQAAAASLACGDFVLILSALQTDGIIFLLGMTEAPGTIFHVFPHTIISASIFARRVTFSSQTTQWCCLRYVQCPGPRGSHKLVMEKEGWNGRSWGNIRVRAGGMEDCSEERRRNAPRRLLENIGRYTLITRHILRTLMSRMAIRVQYPRVQCWRRPAPRGFGKACWFRGHWWPS